MSLHYINRQLKSGNKYEGKDLGELQGVRAQLEEEKVVLLVKMEEANDKRHDERVNAIKHQTTELCEKMCAEVKANHSKEIGPLVAPGGESEIA